MESIRVMDSIRVTCAGRFHRGPGREPARLELSHLDLPQTLAHLGFELGDLNREQLAIVLAAKVFRPVLANLQIEYADRPTAGPEAAFSSQAPPDRPQEAPPSAPAEFQPGREFDEDFGPLEGLHQIARSLPTELAYLNVEPLEFMRRLVTGELRGVVRTPDPNPSDNAPPEPSSDRSAAAQSDEQSTTRPLVAHVLLDVSESMGKRDRRGVIARGAALAFLLLSHERNAKLQLTPFSSTAGETSAAQGASGLHAMAVAILLFPNSGSTNIQGTLTKIAGEALPSQRTDLFLITDGLSTLRDNPLGTAHLHTLRILVAEGNLNVQLQHDLDVNMKILRDWSDTLLEVDLKAILPTLRPTLGDLLPFETNLEDFARRMGSVVSQRQFLMLAREIDNLESLLQHFETSRELELAPLHQRQAFLRLRHLVAECRTRLGRAALATLIEENEARLGTETVQRMRAFDELQTPVGEAVLDPLRNRAPRSDSNQRGRSRGGLIPIDWFELWNRLVWQPIQTIGKMLSRQKKG